MATRLKVGSNRKETLDQLYNITGKNNTFSFFLLLLFLLLYAHFKNPIRFR